MESGLQIALLIGQALVKYGPATARAMAAIFAKPDPTVADWENVFAPAEKSYDDYTKPK
jgi:hypothetical protein